jgi:hypothetical protein
VVRYESVIHEFDPYFNFRTTKYLAHEGFLEFLNWFDDRGWYPLGRTIGGTIYPGLMLTAAVTTSGGACLMQFPEELRIYPDDACLHSLNQLLASKQKDPVQVQYH